MRVEPKTIGIAAVTQSHNHYTTSRTAFSWQSDLFLGIAPDHASEETKSSTAGTIAPADLLPPEYIVDKIDTTILMGVWWHNY